MKVILLEDVKALGKKGQVVEVSDGYAKNFILKKKLGLEATGANMNDLKLQKARDEKVAQIANTSLPVSFAYSLTACTPALSAPSFAKSSSPTFAA